MGLRRRGMHRGTAARRRPPPQLTTRTLLAGMMLTLADNRPAHLTRVHAALTSLPPQAQTRLGVMADWENGPHQLTYRPLTCGRSQDQHPLLQLKTKREDLSTTLQVHRPTSASRRTAAGLRAAP
jgi:hypothetical protein